jgi:AsmA protein
MGNDRGQKFCVELRMATDPQTAAASAGPEKKASSTGWRIFRIVVIGAVASIALLVLFPPLGLIKDQLAKSFGETIGRKVTIGALRLKLRPKLDVELDQVAVANPEGMPARNVLEVETVKTSLDLLPLLKGRVRLDSLTLIKPVLALEEDASGVRNWVLTLDRSGSGTGPAAFSLPPVSTIENGAVSFQSAKTGAQRAISALNSVQTLDPVAGSLAAKGSFVAKAENVAFDVALGDFNAVIGGQSSSLKASVSGRPLTASADGDANFSAAAEFKGDVTASTPSLFELARWLGADTTASGEPLKASLAGKILATTRDVTFSETDVMVNTTSSRFDGVLDLGATRPKLSGAVASEHVDLGRILKPAGRASLAPDTGPAVVFEPEVTAGWQQLLDDLTALERGPQAAAQAADAAAASPANPPWSEQPFNLKSLSALDLDLAISAAAISYGVLDLSKARVKAALTDGVLDADIEELQVGDGKATGTLNLDSRASPPRAAVVLSLSDVAAEPIVTELTGKPLLSGLSNVEITAKAAGQNQSQLTSTLEGKAHFSMGEGALRGFDIRRMIFEWWKSWKFDLAMRTGFQRLEAQYDIKNGILRSQPGLSVGGPEVEINSAGTVNVPNKKLNQEIRVKAIPPPTAFPIPVRISGDWAKPSIGIDWGGLFSAAPGLGGPQALAAAPEPPPVNVQAAIRRVLAADLPQERLTPEARQMLESLLPAEGAP